VVSGNRLKPWVSLWVERCLTKKSSKSCLLNLDETRVLEVVVGVVGLHELDAFLWGGGVFHVDGGVEVGDQIGGFLRVHETRIVVVVLQEDHAGQLAGAVGVKSALRVAAEAVGVSGSSGGSLGRSVVGGAGGVGVGGLVDGGGGRSVVGGRRLVHGGGAGRSQGGRLVDGGGASGSDCGAHLIYY
jgi:hypothetical protein